MASPASSSGATDGAILRGWPGRANPGLTLGTSIPEGGVIESVATHRSATMAKKVLIGLIAFAIVCAIARAGYSFGQHLAQDADTGATASTQ